MRKHLALGSFFESECATQKRKTYTQRTQPQRPRNGFKWATAIQSKVLLKLDDFENWVANSLKQYVKIQSSDYASWEDMSKMQKVRGKESRNVGDGREGITWSFHSCLRGGC